MPKRKPLPPPPPCKLAITDEDARCLDLRSFVLGIIETVRYQKRELGFAKLVVLEAVDCYIDRVLRESKDGLRAIRLERSGQSSRGSKPK
jgi:hypothetical protein